MTLICESTLICARYGFSMFTVVKIEPINSLEFINMFHTILSDCAQPSDCPNGGQNYNCTANVCSCTTGHTLDGDACVGMCYNRCFS